MGIGNGPLSILLASGSPRRRALLADLGWRFEWTAPRVDESPLPGEAPEALADLIGDAGAGTLKALVTESLNEMLAPLRERRAELIANEDYLLSILHAGNERANEQADQTLSEVRTAMQMVY